jgi:hypothetical protein
MELSDEAVRKCCDRTAEWRFVMPPWSERDVVVMAQYCYPNFQIEGVTKRFELYSGRPGYIFTSPNGEEDEEAALFFRLGGIDLEQAFNTVRTGHQSSASYSGNLFTIVPYQYPPKNGDNYGWRKQHFTVEWASQAVLNRAVTVFLSYNVDKVRNIIQATACHSPLAGIRGLFFERYVHRIFQSVPVIMPWRSLENNSSNFTPLRLPSHPLNMFRDISEIKPNSYNVPLSSNFEGIDSLIPSLGIVFQITVSTHHDLKFKVLQTIKNAGVFDEFLSTHKTIRFVFVTDPKSYRGFAYRQYKNTDGEDKKQDVNWIEQFVTLFDITEHIERFQEPREEGDVEEEEKYLTSDRKRKRKLSPNAQERIDPAKRTHVAEEEMEPSR